MNPPIQYIQPTETAISSNMFELEDLRKTLAPIEKLNTCKNHIKDFSIQNNLMNSNQTCLFRTKSLDPTSGLNPSRGIRENRSTVF